MPGIASSGSLFDKMNDTSPAALEVQIRALTAMTPGRRLRLAAGWSRSARQLARASFRQRHPDCTELDLQRHLIESCHGRELADQVYPDAGRHG